MKHMVIMQDNAAVVQLIGIMDYTAKDSIHEMMDQFVNNKLTHVELVMSQVEYVDSAGLGMLLLLRERLEVPIIISSANERIRKVLHLTKLDTMFTIQ